MKVKRCFLEWSLVSRRFAVALTFVLGGGMLLAANLVPLKGVVKDASGEPLAGVTVRIKDGKSGTITDVNGHFVLDVEKGKKLLLSYIGYSETEVLVKDDQQMQIVLKEDAQQLQEVVVVGYGTMEKKQVTSSVTSLSAGDMMKGVGGADITSSLQGKISGLILQNNGSANGTTTIQLRGLTSINSGKAPLIVVDGFPGGDIRALNQDDIKSIDVLKDASAGAIYGTRAASGVILITTKSGSNTNGKVKLKVKPGTQNGVKVRLKGKGFPVYKEEGKFGDLIVTYSVEIPTNLTEKQKELFQELQKLS